MPEWFNEEWLKADRRLESDIAWVAVVDESNEWCHATFCMKGESNGGYLQGPNWSMARYGNELGVNMVERQLKLEI